MYLTLLGMLTRLESLALFSQSRERNFSTFENQDYRPPDSTPIVSGIIVNSSSVLVSVIAYLLHRGRGPHTRHMDAAKQRTLAYLSGRG